MPALGVYKITIDDSSSIEPMNAIVYRQGGPLNWASYTAKVVVEKEDGTIELAETATGVSAHPTQVFSLDSTNNWIYCPAHGYEVGDVWVPATSGSLTSTGLTAAVRYKIVEKDVDWFRVSLRSQGQAVTITGAGTGTHTGYVVGSVQFAPAAANLDTAGLYRVWFVAVSGSDRFHYPIGSNYFELRIETRGN
jgi:hypothetical protein